MTKNEMAATCVAQHIITFRNQAVREAKADFGEPCEKCVMKDECDYDWFSKIASVTEESKVKINMVLPEQS